MSQSQTVCELQALAKKNQDIEVVWLYGSRASGYSNEHSDYDLAVAFKIFNLSDLEKYLRPNELAIDWAMELDLSEYKISVVDINLVPIYLAYNIIEYGKIIYQQQTLRIYKEQNRIYGQYEYQLIEHKNHG